MHAMDDLGIDPNLLPVLAALLRERSVSRAAARLGRSQPAVSHALARLRAQLGDPLLVRVGQRLTLTPRAEALREPLQSLLTSLAALVRPPAAFDPATTARRFVVASTDYIATLVLPRLLPALRRAAPNIDLHLRPGTRAVFTELGEGDADLAFVVRVQTEAGIRARKLFTDRFVCVVRDGHPAARKLDLPTFLKHPHGLIAPLGAAGSFVDDALRDQGLGPRRVAVVVPHFALAPAVVVDTDLILTLPERIAHLLLAAGHPLRVVPLPLRLAAFDVQVAWHDRVHKDPAVAWLRGQLLAAMREP